jgi:MinD-like ATPase involved in chromosome partitioning or flagellar assembly
MNVSLTLRQWPDEPDRRLALNVPVDVPLSELLGDFLDAVEEHAREHRLAFEDSDGWTLLLPDGSSPNGECLSELDVRELALYDASRCEPPVAAEDTPDAGEGDRRVVPPPQDAESQPVTVDEPRAAEPVDDVVESNDPRTAEPVDDVVKSNELRVADPERARGRKEQQHRIVSSRARGQSADRPEAGTRRDEAVEEPPAAGRAPRIRRSRARGPSTRRVVRARAEVALPQRMGTLARVLQALSALSASYRLREAEAFGLEDPARFVREHHRPAMTRVREVWWSTDYERLLEAMILMPSPSSCQTVAVLSPKGGVGKTTITGLLGMLLSFVRRTVTVAVDANPDMSNLSALLCPGRGMPIDRLLKGPLARDGFSPMDVLSKLGDGPDGLYVAPSSNDPNRALSKASYRVLYEKLGRVAEVLVLDCGTGLLDPAAQAALEAADQLVVVCDSRPDTMSMIASKHCRSLLEAFGGPVFLAVNKVTPRVRRRLNLAQFEEALPFARGIVEIAYDEPAAEELPAFSWARHPPTDWAIQLRELAALITASWPESSTDASDR